MPPWALHPILAAAAPTTGPANPHDLPLITTLAAAFTAAWVLGLLTQKLKLSPIVGYLLAVKNVAVPGAIGQSLVATLLGAAIAIGFGMPIKSGLVLGMAMAVAST